MTGQNDFKLTLTLNARIEKVYRAFTDPNEMKYWFGPDAMRAHDVIADARVGGRIAFQIIEASGKLHEFSGTYLEVEPNERLVFTWNMTGIPFETIVTVDFTADGDKTIVVVEQTGFESAALAERHERGWRGSIAKLEDRLRIGQQALIKKPGVARLFVIGGNARCSDGARKYRDHRYRPAATPPVRVAAQRPKPRTAPALQLRKTSVCRWARRA